jgi:single-strand DNA-binding protein
MADLNKVILMGHITADPELKQTQSGTSVCSFSIGVNRRYSKDQAQQGVDFINIVAWRQQAEFVTRYFKKGSGIIVCGSLQTRNWTDNNGQKRYATEVVADEVSFGNSKESSGDAKNNAPAQPYVPSAYSTQSSQDFEEIPGDESLPF